MKIIILLYTCLYSTLLYPQGWSWQYPKPQGNTLSDIYVFDSKTAIAVGDIGTIIKTTDGGNTWNVQHHAGGTEIDLRGVHFTDTMNGWACGGVDRTDLNVILNTKDGGNNWEQIITNNKQPLNSVCFVNPDTGIIVGDNGIILRTTDGGKSWDIKTIEDYTGIFLNVHSLSAIKFTDKKKGWLVGAGFYGSLVFSTIDCGKHWQWQENIADSGTFLLKDICFINRKIGYMTGLGGTLLKTTNGGTNWIYYNIYQKYNILEYGYLSSLFFSDSLKGIIVGGDKCSLVLKTTDGGLNWAEISNVNEQKQQPLYKVRFYDESTGWAIGKYGLIFKSTDGGKTWQRKNDRNYSFRSIFMLDEKNGWATGEKILLKTTDGGASWFTLFQNDSLLLNSILALDDYNLIVVGGVLNINNSIRNAVLIYTSNGGIEWHIQNFSDIGFFYSINLHDRTIWITGSDLILMKSNDRGNTWERKLIEVSYPNTNLRQIQLFDNNVGFILCRGGNSILKSTDGGFNWNPEEVDSTSFLTSFYFLNEQIGFAVADRQNGENIYYTINSGENWRKKGTTITDYNHLIKFNNNNIGWISGTKSHISRAKMMITTDLGETWSDNYTPLNSISDIFVLDSTSWSVGDGIVKYIYSKPVSVSINNGEYYTYKTNLLQNYYKTFHWN